MGKLQSQLLSKVPGIEHAFLDPTTEPPTDFVRCHQVHGAHVMTIEDAPAEELRVAKADGLMTSTKRPVGIQTGDCLPVLYARKNGALVAAVHAGWRGLHQGILIEAVERFIHAGVAPSDLSIAIGPAIGRCCFEVNREVVSKFEETWGHLWRDGAKPWQEGQMKNPKAVRPQPKPSENNLWIDLDAIARLQLRSVGVPDANIEDVGPCTYCGSNELASFRRSTHLNEKSGRQWSWIKRK